MTAFLLLAVLILAIGVLARLHDIERRLAELKKEVSRLRAAQDAEGRAPVSGVTPARPTLETAAPPGKPPQPATTEPPPAVSRPPAPAVPPQPVTAEPTPTPAAVTKPPAPPGPPPALPPKPATPPPPVVERPRPAMPEAPGVAAAAASQAPEATSAPRARIPLKERVARVTPEWESLLGANWLAKLGVAALAVATGFFLKYAFESGWIGPAGRVWIGVCAASVLVGLGQYLLRKPLYRNYAQVLFSGGIVIFFLSIYAASNYYHLIDFPLAFSLLAVAAVAASALAVVNNTQAVALLCLLGGFLTPVLIQDQGVGSGNLIRFYVYLAGLNVWSAGLARYSKWPSLTALSFGATWLLFIGAGPGRKPDVLVAEAFAVVFLAFGCYGSVSTVGRGKETRPEAQALGVVMLIAGCLAFIAASIRLVADVAILGLPGLAIPGILVALVLAAMAAAFPRLPENDLTVRQMLRYLSTTAVVLLIAVSVAAGPATPREQVPAAFLFVLFTYVVFLAAAVHMQRQESGAIPAAALFFATLVTHVVAAFGVLANVQVWGIDAEALWLPLASCVGLAAAWVAARSDSAPHNFRKAAMLGSQGMLLAPLFVALQLLTAWPANAATALFLAEFVLVSGTWVALRRATSLPGYRGDLISPWANAAIFSALLAVVAGATKYQGLVLLAGCATALAAYHGLVGGVLMRRAGDEPLRRSTYLFLALTSGTIAIPLQLKASAITVAWALEGAALVLVGIRARSLWTRWYGVVVLLLAAAKALAMDLDLSGAPALFLNQRMLSGAAVIAAAYFASWLLSRARAQLSEGERSLSVFFLLMATAYAVIFPSMELWALAGRTWAAAGRLSAQHFALSFFWSVFAMSALAIGTGRRNLPLRAFALTLLWLAAAKTLVCDVWLSPAPFHLLLNTRLLSGAVVTAAAGVSAWMLTRARKVIAEGESDLPVLLGLAANVLALIFVSFDLWLCLGVALPYAGRVSAQHLALSLFWSVYAASALAIGIRRRNLPLRVLALLLLSLAAAKALAADLWLSPSPLHLLLNTRFLSGAAVIAAASVSAWLLARGQSVIAQWETPLPAALVVSANALGLVFVSFDLWLYLQVILPAAGRVSAQFLSLSLFWSPFAVGALAVGVRRRHLPLRVFGLALLALTVGKVLLADLALRPVPFSFLLNTRFLSGAAAIVAASVSALLLARRRDLAPRWEAPLPAALIVAANLLALVFISVDLWVHLGIVVLSPGRLGAQHFALTAFWSMLSAAALAAGLRSRNLPLRAFALGLLLLVTAKLVLIDLTLGAAPFRLLLNTRFLSGLAVIAATSAAAWLISRKRDSVSGSEASLVPVLTLAPNLLGLIFISLDIWQYWAAALPGAAGASAQQLSLSIFWSVYAAAGMSVGIWRRSRPVRLIAMGLLYLSVLKVFIFDLSFLEQPYRIVSFFGLGLLLLLVSLLYTRFEGRLK